MKGSKYTMYSIGLGVLFLAGGITTLVSSSAISPANKAMQKTDGEPQKTAMDNSPAVDNGTQTITKDDHKEAVKTLSPKDKTAFQSLSKKDKDKVVQAHKDGGSAQNKLNDVINNDAKEEPTTKKWKAPDDRDTDSPANRAINKTKDQNVYD